MFKLQPQNALGPDCKVFNRVPLSNIQFDLAKVHEINVDLRPDLPAVDMIACILDLETTGLDYKLCTAIELGMVKVGFSNGQLKMIYSVLGMFNQPNHPITDEITEITGITMSMVRGHSFDKALVSDYLQDVGLMIAHNAGFDRPFFDRDVIPTDKVWACSSRGGEINWKVLGYKSSGLENIISQQGYFYDAHRAVVDCIATAWALNVERAAATQLIENAFTEQAKLSAWGSPFSAKDSLKARGYGWDMTGKVWEKTFLSETQAMAEKELLEKEVYRGAMRAATIATKSPLDKYKA
jgi:DNA polymerase III subunit epsilon